MQVIILTAGLGTRVRPHTYSKPKPLVSVAGKPVLAHILDYLEGLKIDEAIFVYGYLGDQIEAYIRKNYAFPMRFVEQADPRGQAHAIALCGEYVQGPLLVIFGDGIIAADFAALNTSQEGVLFVQEVEDPRRFGVAVVEDGRVTRLVEKPTEPVSNLAVIGAYYFPDGGRLIEATSYIMEHNIQTRGEFYIADAIQVMIDRGERFRADSVSIWKDCGTIPALLDSNRYLLAHGRAHAGATTDSVIIPPVYIADDAQVESSVIGPDVAIGSGAVVRSSLIKDSIINARAQVQAAILSGSVVGEAARVEGAFSQLNVGDTSEIMLK